MKGANNMARKIIVVLEDNATRRDAMENVLDDCFYIYAPLFFESSKPMIEWLARNHEEVVLISLDHDLVTSPVTANACANECGDGREVADYLASMSPFCPVIIHSSNSAAADGMERVLTDSDWDVLRDAPYDDTTWIHESWRKTVRRALVDSAVENTHQQDHDFTPPPNVCRVVKNSNRGAREELQYHDLQTVVAWISELIHNEELLIPYVNWLRMQRDLPLSTKPLSDDLFGEIVRADVSLLSNSQLVELLSNPIALFDLANELSTARERPPEPVPIMWCDAKFMFGEFHSLCLGAGDPRIITGNQDVEIRLGTSCIRGIAKWEIDEAKPERFVMFQFPIDQNSLQTSAPVSARDLVHCELRVRVRDNREYRGPDNSKSFPLTAGSDDNINSSWTSVSWGPEALRNATVTIEVCSDKQKAKNSNIWKPRKTSEIAICCQWQHVITSD